MRAYPNPTLDFLFIILKGNQPVEFTLYDTTGRRFEVPTNWNSNQNLWELDVRELNHGLYILEVEQNGKIEKLRIAIH
jgi:hypothetical protein